MKKLLVALLALCIVGVAFAQDAAPALKLSGYLNTGAAYNDNANVTGGANTWGLSGWDSGHAGRININGSYTNGDFGVGFRMRAQDDFTASKPAMYFMRAYGWQNFLSGMVKVQAGRLGDYTWASANGAYNAFGNFDGAVGIQVQVKPMDGLNFGVFVPTTTTSPLPTLSDAFQGSTIGLNYTMADTFDVQAGYQMSPTANAADFYFGGDVMAVKDLSFWFEGTLKNLGSTAVYNGLTGSSSNMGSVAATYILANGSYALGALSAGAWVQFESWGDSNLDSQIAFYPNVSYTLNDMTAVNAGMTYGMAGSKNGINVDANVLLTVNKSSTLRLGGSYALGDLAPAEGEGTWDARANSVAAFVDFVYNF